MCAAVRFFRNEGHSRKQLRQCIRTDSTLFGCGKRGSSHALRSIGGDGTCVPPQAISRAACAATALLRFFSCRCAWVPACRFFLSSPLRCALRLKAGYSFGKSCGRLSLTRTTRRHFMPPSPSWLGRPSCKRHDAGSNPAGGSIGLCRITRGCITSPKGWQSRRIIIKARTATTLE